MRYILLLVFSIEAPQNSFIITEKLAQNKQPVLNFMQQIHYQWSNLMRKNCYSDSFTIRNHSTHKTNALPKTRSTYFGNSSPVSSSPNTPCRNTVSNMPAVWYLNEKALSLGKKPICRLNIMDILIEENRL